MPSRRLIARAVCGRATESSPVQYCSIAHLTAPTAVTRCFIFSRSPPSWQHFRGARPGPQQSPIHSSVQESGDGCPHAGCEENVRSERNYEPLQGFAGIEGGGSSWQAMIWADQRLSSGLFEVIPVWCHQDQARLELLVISILFNLSNLRMSGLTMSVNCVQCKSASWLLGMRSCHKNKTENGHEIVKIRELNAEGSG
jgi:hypothetical protein